MRSFALFISFVLSAGAFAQKTSYPAHKMGAKGVDEIRINGVKGTLRLKAKNSKQYTVKVKHTKGRKGEDWNLSVDRQGGALVLEVFSTEYGREWRKQVRKDRWPEFDIELEGPSQPAVIAWREGSIDVEDWAATVEASFLSGPMTVKGMRGDLKVQAVNTVLRITNHRGKLDLKGESGRVDMEDVQGATDVHWINGTLAVRKCDGPMQVDLTSGEIDARDNKGNWDVKLAEGKASIQNLEGKLKGEGKSSKWDIRAQAPGEVEVTSLSGEVGLKWLSGGVKLFLTTSKGKIDVPETFKVEVREGIQVVEAAVNSKPKGQVFVRTESGKIIWR